MSSSENLSRILVLTLTALVNRQVKHDVYGKRQDEISFVPKHGETCI